MGARPNFSDLSGALPGSDDELLDAYSETVASTVEQVQDAVVSIAAHKDGARGRQGGTGSGFLFTPDGYLLTNSHVVHGATALEVLRPDGVRSAAELVSEDPETEIGRASCRERV